MMRVFFTGAFRKPRELNWLVGTLLLILSLLAGFSGYSLPDDVLSGNGLRITDGVVKSIPIIGSYLSYFIFGGEFPGEHIIPRLFTVHILLVPALILALVGVHLFLMVLNKHTQYPGGGRTDNNVVGYPAVPAFATKMGGNFFIIFGVLASWAARWRSTTSGTTAPTTRPRCPQAPSRTGTCCSSRDRCASCRARPRS